MHQTGSGGFDGCWFFASGDARTPCAKLCSDWVFVVCL